MADACPGCGGGAKPAGEVPASAPQWLSKEKWQAMYGGAETSPTGGPIPTAGREVRPDGSAAPVAPAVRGAPSYPIAPEVAKDRMIVGAAMTLDGLGKVAGSSGLGTLGPTRGRGGARIGRAMRIDGSGEILVPGRVRRKVVGLIIGPEGKPVLPGGGIAEPPGPGNEPPAPKNEPSIEQDENETGDCPKKDSDGKITSVVYGAIDAPETAMGETPTQPGAAVSIRCYARCLVETVPETGDSATVPLFKGYPTDMWGDTGSVKVRVYYGPAKVKLPRELDAVGLLFGLLVTGTSRKITFQQVCWWKKTESSSFAPTRTYYNDHRDLSHQEFGDPGHFYKDSGPNPPCRNFIGPDTPNYGDVAGAVEATAAIGPGRFWSDFPSASTNQIANHAFHDWPAFPDLSKFSWDMRFQTWVYLGPTAIGYISWGHVESYKIVPVSGRVVEREIAAGDAEHAPKVISRFDSDLKEASEVSALYSELKSRKVLY